MKILCVLLLLFILTGCALRESRQLREHLYEHLGKEVELYPAGWDRGISYTLAKVGSGCLVIDVKIGDGKLFPTYKCYIPYHAITRVTVLEKIIELHISE